MGNTEKTRSILFDPQVVDSRGKYVFAQSVSGSAAVSIEADIAYRIYAEFAALGIADEDTDESERMRVAREIVNRYPWLTSDEIRNISRGYGLNIPALTSEYERLEEVRRQYSYRYFLYTESS